MCSIACYERRPAAQFLLSYCILCVRVFLAVSTAPCPSMGRSRHFLLWTVRDLDLDLLNFHYKKTHVRIYYNIEGMKKNLDTKKIEYTHRKIPDFPLEQLFIDDPDGVKVELNYAVVE